MPGDQEEGEGCKHIYSGIYNLKCMIYSSLPFINPLDAREPRLTANTCGFQPIGSDLPLDGRFSSVFSTEPIRTEPLGALRECFRMEALLTAPLPKAKKDNKLSKTLSDLSYDKNSKEGLWRAFNNRTDTIFGNRVFACEGATTQIERGEHGIIVALAFFKAFSKLPLPFDIAVLKVQRVYDELQRVL